MSHYTSTLWAKLYEDQLDKNEIDSTTRSGIELLPPRNLSQRWRRYGHDAKRRVFERFSKWCPKGSATSNLFIYLKTDQTFPEFVLKSIIGFFGGVVLTYLCFMFFVFQLSISLIHATIMSSIIGVLLTFGLAFSYRIRCLVFLLIPQLFSRAGRYTLTCYALVLILTGPATNTLRNSEVLTESMACTQEQIKTDVKQITDSGNKPFNSIRSTIKLMIERLDKIGYKVDEMLAKINGLVTSIVDVLQSSYSWLHSIADKCNERFGTPYVHCTRVLTKAGFEDNIVFHYQELVHPNASYIVKSLCSAVKPKKVCVVTEVAEESIAATIKRRLRTFTTRMKTMFFVKLRIHHSYSLMTNASRSPSQVTAGIVTEIRNRADSLITWLSWSSCVTSMFLLLIIFRAKHYQHMFETRSRFDNRYITKELMNLNLQRLHEGKETVLPLNRREQAKYVTTTSLRLVASERVHLTRSIVFMIITTLKLMIHMVADYSLYWVLITIQYHGKRQTNLPPGPSDAGILITGTGLFADMLRSIFKSLTTPVSMLILIDSSKPCLPNPYPPDLKRYTQIVVLIFLLWFFALFEPYGLRLRHLIMGHYRPERANARAVWLYNHILRTRGSFMKFARRKLHKEFKYLPEENLTFRYWLCTKTPIRWFGYILGVSYKDTKCLLCDASKENNSNMELIRCETQRCPGTFCASCFTDIGRLCTICVTPVDYGDISDVSLERGSSYDSDSDSDESDSFNKKLTPKPMYFFKSETKDHNENYALESTNQTKKTYFTSKRNGKEDSASLLESWKADLENENSLDFYIQENRLNMTNFTVPKRNYTVGYVYQNYFCNEKILVSPLNDFASSNKDKYNKYSFYGNTKDKKYGTFETTIQKDSQRDVKEEINSDKMTNPYKLIRGKRRCIKNSKKTFIGNVTFKINRKYSHKYYQVRLGTICKTMRKRRIKLSNIKTLRKLNINKCKFNKYNLNITSFVTITKTNARKGVKSIDVTSSNSKTETNPKENNLSHEALSNRDNTRRKLKLPRDDINMDMDKSENEKNQNNYNHCIISHIHIKKLFCVYLKRLKILKKNIFSHHKFKRTLPFLKQRHNCKRRKKYLKYIHRIREENRRTRKYRIYSNRIFFRFRNSVRALKSIFSSLSVTKNKNSTSDVIEQENNVLVNKDVSVPIVKERACQCQILKPTLDKFEARQLFKNQVNICCGRSMNNKDKQVPTESRTCLYNSKWTRNNKDGCKFKGDKKDGDKLSSKALESKNNSTRTNTACSRVSVNYDDETIDVKGKRKDNKSKVNVITKGNQSTGTEQSTLGDVSTATSDWWSPLVEKKVIHFHEADTSIYKKGQRKSLKTPFHENVVTFKS